MKQKITFETDEHREISPGLVLAALVLLLIGLIGSGLVIYSLIKIFGAWLLIAVCACIALWSCWIVVRDFIL